MYLIKICLILLLSYKINCGKILGIFWTHSKSHHILGSSLLQELAKKGHNVTFFSTFKDDVNLTNYNQKLITGADGFFEEMTATPSSNIISFLLDQAYAVQKTSELFWKNIEIQNLINSNEKYDVTIIFHFDNDAILGISHHVGSSTILFSPMGAYLYSRYVGNPNLACYSCSLNLLAVNLKTFFGRLLTATMNCFFYLEDSLLIHPSQQIILKKYLPHSPDLKELKNNVSLVLANSHFSIEGARPHVPNVIQIGGFHTKKTKNLPKDLQVYLDNATNGAILFSFGSNIKIANLEKEKLKIITNGFGKIKPYKVIFKSDVEIENLPHNILLKKWIPQNDVLSHSNVKLFVSHGGLGGTTEALYHGVPILGIPFFADQKDNVALTSSAGYTLPLNFDDLTEENFDKALNEILKNKTYEQKVKIYSKLLRKQAIKPAEHAIWWIEHIIENKGGKHLRNIAMDLTWYEFYMIDIILFCLIILFLIISVIFYFFKKIYQKKMFKLKSL